MGVRPSFITNHLEIHLVLRVLNCIFPDKLQFHQLKQLLGVGYGFKYAAEVYERAIVADGRQGGKGIALAGRVTLSLEERRDELRSIRDEGRRV